MLSLIRREEVEPEAWDEFVSAHADGWFWHTSGWIDYQVLAKSGRDASAAIVTDAGSIVGVVPLVVVGDAATMDGSPEPLYADDVTARLSVLPLWRHAVASGVLAWETRSRPLPACAHHREASETRVLDVSRPESELWRGVRKSYHSLINKANREHVVEVHSATTWLPIARTLSRLHATAAGRQTRPYATWELMERWARAGRALVVTATPPTVEADVAAFIYVYAWKDWAYYGTGVSFAKNVTHALQWAAIAALGARGVRNYELGYLPAEPSEKDRGIQTFKAGFGGVDRPVRISNVEFDQADAEDVHALRRTS